MIRRRALVVAVLAVAACHGEPPRAEQVPIDTAAAFPAPDSLGLRPRDTVAASPGSTTVALGPAPPSIVYRSDSAAGYALYHGRGRCFTCHGQRAEGTQRLGPALTDTTWLNGDGSLDSIGDVIGEGVAVPREFSVAMPAYAGTFTNAEIAQMAAYVYSISHAGVTLPDSLRPDTTALPADTDTSRAEQP